MQDHHGGLRYCAYLLRCWQEPRSDGSGAGSWRFSLEDPHTSMRRGFATWEALITFLHDELCVEAPSTRAGAAEA